MDIPSFRSFPTKLRQIDIPAIKSSNVCEKKLHDLITSFSKQ